ncbi:RNA polymerase subunit sigma-70 [Nonomuraea sp. NPDC050536]|uniref:RNA polymerase subunit sigma-70 n=1 Tax=Nonomuraea sp. NPDC050536 TaxID=3364366 RepID=UPI0037C4FE5B
MDLEAHRAELTGYCYRMLGSGFEAEDAVQETLIKAWQGRFDPDRGTARAWLFRIATNVCIDMLRGTQRRARAMDLGPAVEPGSPLGEPLPGERWLWPSPTGGDPADVTISRESVRLAFLAALQHLPPRQRATLLLRDVLGWSAAEVAGLLESSVASVNSALQRARASMPAAGLPYQEVDEELLGRYVDAFERHDVELLVSLLHEDATMTMPPFGWWLDGRGAIAAVLRVADAPCGGARLVRAGVGMYGQYVDGRAFGLLALETAGGLVTGSTTYLDPELFRLFGLPMSFEAGLRTNG